MADSFGLKIGLEGEKEFKKALAEINQSFKVLGSEMKLATSQFDKNDKSVEALAARNKVLRKEIDEQTTKIDTLRKALQNAATSFGESDRRTQNWQIQLNNAEAALNDMNRELDENEKAIKEGGKAAEESGSKFEGFGKVLKTVGVALGAVAVAAGAAAVKLGKEVIAAYADYEQLVGGVDTLFKDSSQEIQRYAANAYKTAGLSANEYMETVTGFSASLIQSLGGDTEKAAKYADMAITDMSDNANKMGTDMSSIQNAYQGFAYLCLIINSKVFSYYHLLTSRTWMVERDALEAGDIRTIPIPEPSEEMLGKAVELYEHIKISGDESLLDAFVFDAYRLKDYETYLVTDALDYIYNYFDKKSNSIAFKKPSIEVYRKYYSTFMDVLKNSLGQSFTPKASFYIGESPLSILVLSISENSDGNLIFFDNNKSTEQCLSQLDSLLTEERYNIYIRRNVRVYGKDSIYIVKPKQQKYWNYSSACRDADELFSDIMKAKG